MILNKTRKHNDLKQGVKYGLEKRKLTDYEKAGLWAEIDRCGSDLRDNNRNHQNSGEFYKTVDKLVELQKKLKWHEVACTVEQGEKL
jgi:hypothetical protein